MREAKYIVEIYEPGSADTVLASYTSPSPFMHITRGSLINPNVWENFTLSASVLRVINVEHSIHDSGGLTHKVNVFTQVAEDIAELGLEADTSFSDRVKQMTAQAKQLVTGLCLEDLKKQGTKAIEQLVPRIQTLVRDNVGPVANDVLQNEQAMRNVFLTVYNVMPAPVRFMVGEEAFIDFCLQNQYRLLEKAEANKVVDAETRTTTEEA